MIVQLARTLRALLVLALLVAPFLAASSLIAHAQAGTDQGAKKSALPPSAPTFDVTAIHLHEPLPHEHNSITSSPWDGHFHAANVSLLMLIRWAFETPETRILGTPAWADRIHYDVEANADPSLDSQLKKLTSDAGREKKQLMVQALLRERFRLVIHTETRQLPIYALVVAKGGPNLGIVRDTGTLVNHGRDYIEVQASDSLAVLAEELSKDVGRDVIDKTGITGRYNLKLKWTPDDGSTPQPLNGAPTDSGPSIFSALQEQLGLKLEPEKAPVPVLVVDHVEMPTEN